LEQETVGSYITRSFIIYTGTEEWRKLHNEKLHNLYWERRMEKVT
jgi:hypothetical protein